MSPFEDILSPSIGLDSGVAVTAAADAAAAMDDLAYLTRRVGESHMKSAISTVKAEENSNSLERSGIDGITNEVIDKQHEAEIIPSNVSGHNDLKVIFDGTSRVLCNFSIKLSERNEAVIKEKTEGSTGFEEEKESSGLEKRICLKGIREDNENGSSVEDVWVQDHLIGPDASGQSREHLEVTGNGLFVVSNGNCMDHNGELEGDDLYATVEMSSYSVVDQEDSVSLGDKVICPRVEDDIICRMIHVDQIAYKAVIKAARQRMTDIMHSGVRERYRTATFMKTIFLASW